MDGSCYERIGVRYAAARRADSRIANLVTRALGDAAFVANVGAGTGSYEPSDRRVVAVELSRVMLGQDVPGLRRQCKRSLSVFRSQKTPSTRPWRSSRCTTGRTPSAELAELRRVASDRVVVLTIASEQGHSFWLTTRYFPAAGAWNAEHFLPICSELGGTVAVTRVPIPSDCEDGFLGAFWRRPHSYLDPTVQAGISAFMLMRDEDRRRGERLLGQELQNGEWHRQFGHLLQHDELDVGYRLITAQP